MPIFEYKCNNCGRISEFLVNTDKKASLSCPHCDSKDLIKQISTFAPMVKEGQSKRCYGCTDGACPHAGL